MKKKYVGLSYESDDGYWRLEGNNPLEGDGDTYNLCSLSKRPLASDFTSTHISIPELISLRDLINGVLKDIGAEEPVEISNMGTSFVPTVVAKMDPRFHPDPDGVMGW